MKVLLNDSKGFEMLHPQMAVNYSRVTNKETGMLQAN